jgi:putative transposase
MSGIYIDLKMVRAGLVRHPSEWACSGYNEIQVPRRRYALIDYEGLRRVLGFRSHQDLAASYRRWIERSLEKGNRRDAKWTESIAVGSESFVRATKRQLGLRAKSRQVLGRGGSYSLRESQLPYNEFLGYENDVLRSKNEYFWKNIN